MQELFRKYLDNQCTTEELSLLLNHFDNPENELLLKDLIHESLGNEQADTDNIWTGTTERVYNNIKGRILPTKGKLIPIYKKAWVRLAAACIIIMLGVGSYFLFNKTTNNTGLAENNLQKDVEPPKATRAMITLTNGQQVYLDSAANGELAMQSNIKLVKLASGEIVYQTATGETVNEIQYNTLSNPRGSKAVSLALNDGTKVWLNSESSLKYPVAFVGNERKVEITGEAYFEVAKDASKPFKVNVAGKGEVEVLGTHFNVNSYADETTINTTLLEGSVRVTSLITHSSSLISPGQQAQLNANGLININSNADVEEVMAWKNGKFIFQDLDIQSIMRQIGKWYDVDVEYRGTITKEEFVGVISRNVNISEIIKMLEKTGVVHFEIEGKKIIVK